MKKQFSVSGMKAFAGKLSMAAGLAGVLMFAASAHASFLTSDSLSSPTVIDFSTQATVSDVPGPIQIGTPVGLDIQATGNPNTGLYTNYNGWGLVGNGNWGSPKTYISANNARNPGEGLIFQFLSGPISGVGGFMNYATGAADLIISAYDSSHILLEQYNVSALAPISTPGGFNDGAFRGIQRAAADISYFEVFGYVPVLDDLTFTTGGPAAVPEPITMLLLGLGLVGIAGMRRKLSN